VRLNPLALQHTVTNLDDTWVWKIGGMIIGSSGKRTCPKPPLWLNLSHHSEKMTNFLSYSTVHQEHSHKIHSSEGILYWHAIIQFFRCVRGQLKCDGTCAETRLCLLAKRTSAFKSAGVSVQSTTGSWGVHISGSNGINAGYTMFQGSVKGTGYPLHSPVSPSLPLPYVTMCHHISTGVYKVISLDFSKTLFF